MGSLKGLFCGAALATLMIAAPAAMAAAPAGGSFSMQQVLSYPYPLEMASAERGQVVAWVRDYKGVRNVWIATGPDFTGRQLTHYEKDDGQEITQLTFSPDGSQLVYVRGGDHDENWPAAGNLDPDPDSSTEQPKITIWGVNLKDGALTKITEGDAPAISAKGQLAYISNDQVWTTTLDGKGKPERLFFDRGHDSDLQWSPDGSRLAFVSERGDHAFVGVYTDKDKPLEYLAPTTNIDQSPRWSHDGTRIAFTQLRGRGGPPQPLLKETPEPWSIWVADASTGEAHKTWQSPDTLDGSYPGTAGEANLTWVAGDRLAFTAELDNWPHLYSVPAAGGDAMLLTPGQFMVEHVTVSRDGKYMVYDANTGSTPNDLERRHLFRVPVDRATPEELTGGTTLEWSPFMASDDKIAFIGNDGRHPPQAQMVSLDGKGFRNITANDTPADYPWQDLIVPKPVTYTAPDGTTVHADLFQRPGGSAQPAVIFVHGGPPRQMMLGWHYMDYYSNGYAVNQYLAAHGFTVLAVNYRLGIGYGRAFQHPEGGGPRGSSEYQDVLAGARFLQHQQGVDPNRIGIWGGSYGGLLTALALARNSDVFKAGVDFHGVHDWSQTIGGRIPDVAHRYEKGDHDQAMTTAWTSSPDADVGKWTSPVLLIQGDDDRNVDFHETVDLARRLEAQHTYFEEMVIPNEIHGFLRYDSWLRADTATAAFLAKELKPGS